jgi:uncharacterized protein YndB with AHSA1/START domain
LRPDTFLVQRARVVEAPPERILPLIEDPRAFNTWNPFVVGKPPMPLSYAGPDRGAGAVTAFGPGQGGKGRLTVLSVEPRRVGMRLDMDEPLEAHNDIAFSLQPEGGGTRVSWAMTGHVPFVGKIVHVLVDMDKMIGGEMERGLADLARAAEK